MSAIRILWLALGLASLGFILIWQGTFNHGVLLWLGLAVFIVALLLGVATRYVGREL